jgi:hypothetical protein
VRQADNPALIELSFNRDVVADDNLPACIGQKVAAHTTAEKVISVSNLVAVHALSLGSPDSEA